MAVVRRRRCAMSRYDIVTKYRRFNGRRGAATDRSVFYDVHFINLARHALINVHLQFIES